MAIANSVNFNGTFPASGTMATTAGSETLTNKTLTSPIISTISNTGTLTLPTATGNVWASGSENVNTAQSAFCATCSTTQASVTGDGTAYTVQFATEKYDQNNDFDSSTGIFTAPTTGKYCLTTSIYIENITSSHTLFELLVNTTSLTYATTDCSYRFNSSGDGILMAALNLPLTVADQVKIELKVSGSSKTIDIASTSNYSFFSMTLMD